MKYDKVTLVAASVAFAACIMQSFDSSGALFLLWGGSTGFCFGRLVAKALFPA